jgi:hypothetical protein
VLRVFEARAAESAGVSFESVGKDQFPAGNREKEQPVYVAEGKSRASARSSEIVRHFDEKL